MSTLPPPGERAAVVAGVGGWVPPEVVTNEDLSPYVNVSDEWIHSRTGIRTRHRVSPGMSTSDLAVQAGRLALASAGDERAGAVIVATTTPDRICPATAPDVAARLGLAGAPAFDISAVCAGFVHGLAAAAGLIAAGIADRVLLVGADAMTTIVDPTDRPTAIVFGDGAGAVVLRAGDRDEPGALGPVVLGTDGTLSHLIEVPAGGSRQRSQGKAPEPGAEFMHMEGRDTFRHAVEQLTSSSRQAVTAAGWTMEDIDRIAAHQANSRILAAVAERLGIPAEHQLSNIADVGNTGAASIPLLLAQSHAEGRLVPGNRTLLTAFGAGLAWGASTLTWPKLHNG